MNWFRHNIGLLVLAGCLFVVTGYINLTATEVLPPMLCLLIGAGLLGILRPKAAWRWGLLMGLSVPLSYFFVLAVNIRVAEIPRFPITLAVLVIPATVAAYLGVLVRAALRPTAQPLT